MAPPPPPSSPPPPQQPAEERRLVRDPYSRLGGVASGVAHYFGIDVSVVRILFVLAALATGFGFLLYLVAWMIIPRATYWPPAGPARSVRSWSGRDLGLGLAVVGVMVALGFGAGGPTGTILIPLVLVAGGVWLLIQQPAADADAAAAEQVDTAGYRATGPVGAPVPPPSRRRRIAVIGVFATIGLFLVAIPLLIFAAIIAAVVGGSVAFDLGDEAIVHRPATVAAIPEEIVSDAAEVVIDLSRLEAADFDTADGPVPVDVDVDFGSVTVIVPDDVDVDVDANVDIGQVSVFGDVDDGFGNRVTADGGDTGVEVELDLDVDVGEIEVVRA